MQFANGNEYQREPIRKKLSEWTSETDPHEKGKPKSSYTAAVINAGLQPLYVGNTPTSTRMFRERQRSDLAQEQIGTT